MFTRLTLLGVAFVIQGRTHCGGRQENFVDVKRDQRSCHSWAARGADVTDISSCSSTCETVSSTFRHGSGETISLIPPVYVSPGEKENHQKPAQRYQLCSLLPSTFMRLCLDLNSRQHLASTPNTPDQYAYIRQVELGYT